MNNVCTRLLPLLALASGAALADDYHYRNMLVGDRAAGLGGAYAAVADDASGLYYNPAGIVYAGSRRLSASVNAYQSTTTRYKDVLGGDWTRESSTLLPNFFGVVQPLGKGMAGISYAVPDSILENQDEFIENVGTLERFLLNVNNEDNTYRFGPSYAYKVNDRLAVGGTLYIHLRDTEQVVNQAGNFTDGSAFWQNSYLETTEWGYQPILGVMWTPADQWAVGATLRKNFVASSDASSQQTECTSPCVPLVVEPASLDVDRVYPTTLTMGLAHFPNDRLMWTVDFDYHTAADGEVDADLDSTYRSKEATWNVAAGAEYYFSPNWNLRGGIYTDNANTPTLKSGGTNQPEHIDLLGLSASVSRFTRTTSITMGMSYAFGSGKAQPIAGSTRIVDADISALTLYLSTAYSY